MEDFIVKINANNKIIEKRVIYNENLYSILTGLGFLENTPCGGKCFCGKCKVKIYGDLIDDIDIKEKAHLSETEIKNGIRLACAYQVKNNITVELQDKGNAQIATHSSAFERTVSIHKDHQGFGAAIDIGTTTVVVYVLNLSTGQVLSCSSRLNVQKHFGADIITRINYTIENIDGKEVLQNLIINQLEEQLKCAVSDASLKEEDISRITVAGNTAMLHFLTGKDASKIAKSPFTPTFLNTVECYGSDLGIYSFDKCKFILLPGISAFVGADITAAIIAGDLYDSKRNWLLLDIGTNGEIVLGTNTGKIYCCSAAAGPAFEGARLSCGMGGVSGAINSFKLKKGLNEINVIGDALPIGICGSGVVDIVAELLDAEIIDDTGRFTTEDKKYQICENVYLSAQDIREIQLAKAAIAAGVNTLLKVAGISPDQVDQLLVAGGFGSYINTESGLKIGLIPKRFKALKSIGNAAGAGAALCLMNDSLLKKATEIAKTTEYYELSGSSIFNDEYIDCISFENE